ncbi:peptidoglycan-binding domain-containing protein [Methylocella sp.]|uniref:peptidoglycan-binding domain-containing protein n=1 Tax=Methylocella sp. TaxID=1978226 RepID=UPI0037843DCE
MREALAAADHDFTLSEPRARRPRASRGGGGAKRAKPRAGEPRKKIAAVALTLLGVGALAGVLVNALALQKTRHPAPLFARAVVERPAAAAPAPVPAPRPERLAEPRDAEPVHAEAAAPEERPAPRAAPARTAALAPEAAPPPRPHDPISDLIRNGGVAREAAPAVSRSVMAAQKALVKLGFVLKADGVMGASTRQAIESFERDRGRKSAGELTPAVMKALGAESGIAVN